MAISLDIHSREQLFKVHSGLMHDIRQAHQWFDSPDVPAEDKEGSWLTLFNMRDQQLFIYKLLRAAGVTETQLAADLDLPF